MSTCGSDGSCRRVKPSGPRIAAGDSVATSTTVVDREKVLICRSLAGRNVKVEVLPEPEDTEGLRSAWCWES
jgi:hypothetical protein